MSGDPSQTLDMRIEALTDAIGDLYIVFKRYPLRREIASSPFSDNLEQDRALLAAPLRELPADSLVHVGYSALTTWGTPEDFKHFLPRLLELAATDPGFIDIEILIGKFRYGEWNHWLQSERRAIETYLRAFWSRALGEFPCPLESIGAILCAIAGALDDLQPLLDEWRLDFGSAALRHLAEFVIDEAPRLVFHKELSNAFWTDRLPQMRQVIAWLASPELLRHVEKCFYLHCKDSLAQPMSDALRQLEALRAQGSPRPPA